MARCRLTLTRNRALLLLADAFPPAGARRIPGSSSPEGVRYADHEEAAILRRLRQNGFLKKGPR